MELVPRHLRPVLVEALAESRVVCLLGARQSGKSTLVRSIAQDEVPARYRPLDDPATLEALQALATGRRRVTVETTDDTLTVGRHSFQPAEPTEVLTLAQLAALLQTEEEAVRALAESGDLPGRQVGEEWRFVRSAILEWLARDG